MSEEHEIYTHYNGCHRHHVKHSGYLSAHFSKTLDYSDWAQAPIHVARRAAADLSRFASEHSQTEYVEHECLALLP